MSLSPSYPFGAANLQRQEPEAKCARALASRILGESRFAELCSLLGMSSGAPTGLEFVRLILYSPPDSTHDGCRRQLFLSIVTNCVTNCGCPGEPFEGCFVSLHPSAGGLVWHPPLK